MIGLRWRTEKEVISGKGQFICGNKHCDKRDGLTSYEGKTKPLCWPSGQPLMIICEIYLNSTSIVKKEVNFSYFEAGENKQALVKLVTCERERVSSDDDTENEHKQSRERRKGFPCSAHQHFSEVQSGLMAVFPGSLQERRLQPQLAIIRLKMTKLLMSSLRECFHKFELNHCFYIPRVPTLFLTTMVN
ncbi:Protein FRA10AC1 [Vitis vinifera]|uniref:Protein FRA10AC1 n=1 Tax=Vitis vinifera TaxID=29760 RepID=A0A438J1P1_VITVI|nr:Protein FRA10AC1 [Vitis vinifera]